MKWNGRFFPFEEERDSNDPDKDFPILDEVRDFTGETRQFEITYRDVGLGYVVDAREQGKEEGYQFAAFDASSPYVALGKLRDKMGRMLAVRHLVKEHGQWQCFHFDLRGRITCDDERGAVFVVDGVPLSLEDLGRIALTHEGWEFSLKFIDRTDEV